MWNIWTDWGSKHWKVRDACLVFLILVTLRHIYMNRFLSLEVRENFFLLLIPESHHCMLNGTYMFFFQISSSEITFSFNRKWILMACYFLFPFLNSTFCFCDKILISPWHTIIGTKASCKIYISSIIYNFIQQIFPRVNVDSKGSVSGELVLFS